jgi:hypothetical protein
VVICTVGKIVSQSAVEAGIDVCVERLFESSKASTATV